MLVTRAFFLIILFTISLPASVKAADSLPLPANQQFELLIDALDEALTDPHWQCAAGRDERCDCLEFNVRDGRVLIGDVTHQPGHFQASRVTVSSAEVNWQATDLEIIASDGDYITTFSDAIWWSDADTAVSVKAKSGKFSTGAAGIHIDLQGLVWHRQSIVGDSPESCMTLAELSSSSSDAPAVASAVRAEFAEGQWSVDEFRPGGLARPRLSSNRVVDRSPAGLLPPSVRFDDSGARATAGFYVGGLPLSINAHADTDAGGGLGIAYWSRTPFCAGQKCRPDPLEIQAFSTSDGPSAVHVGGATLVGNPQRHLSASLDGIERSTTDTPISEMTRLERGAFFRDWSSQQVGIAASSARHDLVLSAAAFSSGGHGLEPGSTEDWKVGVGSRYGTHLDLGTAGRADFRLQHREFEGSALESGRISQASLRVDRLVGSTQRIYMRPALRGQMTMGVVDHSTGSVAGSRSEIDVLIDGGLAFQGRIGRFDHRVSPQLFAGRHIITDDALPADFSDLLVAETGQSFHFTGATLEQRLELSDGVQLRFPVGVAVVDDGRGNDWSALAHGSLEFASTRSPRPILVGVDGRCADGCADVGLMTRMHLGLTEKVAIVQTVGRGGALRSGAPFLDRAIRAGVTDGLASTLIGPDDAEPIVHTTRVRGNYERWRGEFGAFGDARHLDETGAELMVEQFWRELGWGVGVRVAALPHQRRWAASLGFSNLPAF